MSGRGLATTESRGLLPAQRRLVDVWYGDNKKAAELLCVTEQQVASWVAQEWFAEAVDNKNRLMMTQNRRDKALALAEQVLAKAEVQAYWSWLVSDKDARPADRLKASELLAKSLSMFVKRVEVSHEVGPMARPLDLAERLSLLGVEVRDAEVVTKEDTWLD